MLEVMVCGLSFLLHYNSHHRKIVGKSPASMELFSLEDSKDLAEKIKKISSKNAIQFASEASLEGFRKYFTAKRMAENYMTLYEEALERGYVM